MPQSSAIRELHAAKEALKARLLEAIREFETNTGLCVHDVRLAHHLDDWSVGRSVVSDVTVDVRL